MYEYIKESCFKIQHNLRKNIVYSIPFVKLNNEKYKMAKWWKETSAFFKTIRRSEDIIDNILEVGIDFNMCWNDSLKYFTICLDCQENELGHWKNVG